MNDGNGTIDLRSDTVTQPTSAMRDAMSRAEVGDDVYGEDPTARRLEERVADLFGKEAALFVPSGTMANQIALLLHCRAGQEAIVGRGAHLFYYEGGAGGAWAGAQFVEVGTDGLFTADDMEAAIKPKAYYLPETRLVCLENTHNRAGGRVFPQDELLQICERARHHDLSIHLDGARIWNASIASGQTIAELVAPADTVTACFSKGLGAPVGSVLVGRREHIDQALRLRRMMGGAMRQVGVLCAAALFALEHHVDRLEEDHQHARQLATGLAGLRGVACDTGRVETNIVNFDLERVGADAFVAAAARQSVLVNAIGPRRVRAVTHLGIDRRDIDRAIEVFAGSSSAA